jgi:hypothetical protein
MFLAGDGIPYDIVPLNGTQPGQGYIAFDGAVGAYSPWYTPCDTGNNTCINDYGPIAVQVIDQYGAPVADYPIYWGVTVGNGAIDPNNSDVETNENGIAGAAVYVGSSPGPQEFAVEVIGPTGATMRAA